MQLTFRTFIQKNGTYWKYVSVLEETEIDGYDCLKIKIQRDIKESGVSEQSGVEIEKELEGGGESIIYFAYKEGMILKVEDLTALEGVIRAGDQTIPTSTESSKKTVVSFSTIQWIQFLSFTNHRQHSGLSKQIDLYQKFHMPK